MPMEMISLFDMAAFGRPAKSKRFTGIIEIFTEFINKTENIPNFIEVNQI
jgi:hypothetical protein